jgi:hypothetical protein
VHNLLHSGNPGVRDSLARNLREVESCTSDLSERQEKQMFADLFFKKE